LKEIGAFTRQDLAIPVLNTSTGRDYREGPGDVSIISELVNPITKQAVSKATATAFPEAARILGFGPG